MQLTREEQLRISIAAKEMMKAFGEFSLAEDRLQIANTISGKMAAIGLPDSVFRAALQPYSEKYSVAQKQFFEALGIGEDNKEFWEWAKSQPPSMSELKEWSVQ